MELTFLLGNDYAFRRSSRFLSVASIEAFAEAIRFFGTEDVLSHRAIEGFEGVKKTGVI